MVCSILDQEKGYQLPVTPLHVVDLCVQLFDLSHLRTHGLLHIRDREKEN